MLVTTLLILSGAFTLTAKADGPGFSVSPVLPENSQVGYFDLQMNPGEEKNVQFVVSNTTNKDIVVNVDFGTAFTGSTGTVGYVPGLVKADPSLKYNLKDNVKLPKEVALKANGKATVTATVKMPDAQFKGVIAGGFNFKQKSDETDASNKKKSGVTIKNEYRYIVGLILQQSRDIVKPELALNAVAPSQVNARNVISANLSNSAMSYLMDMNTQATVKGVTDPSVKYEYSNSEMKMAPNSNFDLAVPVSQKSGANGQFSEPLKPGTYHLSMTVYGQKDQAGAYQTNVGDQTVKYLYKWQFEKDFTITAQKAKELNKKDVTLEKKFQINWLLIVGIIIILLLIFILFALRKKNKKEDETEKEVKK